ncbi:MAG: homocysteine S-methyltransferase family protein, partial [Candidatus Humimicrobiaceae bacterium]
RESDPKARLMFQPNAGMPVLENGKTTYKESEDIMAENIKEYLQYKPSIIGACCGSTPAHIKKIASLISPQ